MPITTVRGIALMYEKKEMRIRNEHADDYDDWYLREKGSAFREIEMENLIRQIRRRDGLLLDIGCGTGNECRFFDSKLFVGIDISLRSLEVLRRKYRNHQVVLAEAKHLPFRSSTFSRILAVQVLQHIPDISLAIQEAARVLKQMGVIAADVYCRKRMLSDEGYWPSGIYFRSFNPERLSRVFLDNGFASVKVSYSNYFSKRQLGRFRFASKLIDRFMSKALHDGAYLIGRAKKVPQLNPSK
jgi:SAM-dependent methyltransferase